MAGYPRELYVGPIGGVYAGDEHDRGLDYTGTVASGVVGTGTPTIVCKDDNGQAVSNPTSNPSVSGLDVAFHLTVPATPGRYWLFVTTAMDSGESVTLITDFRVFD